MKKKYKWIFLIVCLVGIGSKMKAQVMKDSTKAPDGTLTYVKFDNKQQAVPQSNALQVLKRLLHFGPDDTFQLMDSQIDQLGYQHDYYQQFYANLKVEGAVYALHSHKGLLESANGTFAKIKLDAIRPTVSESMALESALAFMPANQYQWEVTGHPKPKGQLLIVKDKFLTNRVYVLAYKFVVEAADPAITKAIFVDAQTGRVIHHKLLTQPIFPYFIGTAQTRYSGQRKITTELHGNTYRLQEIRPGVARGSKIRISTLNMHKKGTNYIKAFDFKDHDNNWTAAEHDNEKADNAALDAHWGAENVIDFFAKVLGRNSINGIGGPVISYVHFLKNWENAQWDAVFQVMRYGDGYNSQRPYTALDVVAHEIGHGICQNTPYGGLDYVGESGALNEGFSDIWAATIENYYAKEKQTWLIAEEVRHNGLRNMANPNDIKAYTQCPDTYGGKYWKDPTLTDESNDYGGVHYNSSVLNHWFYLLSIGAIGVNDLGNEFELTGIGIINAAKIAYRAEIYYLKPEATFEDARIATIQAAEDLYGVLSSEVKKVAHAWYAVGVGNFNRKQGLTKDVPNGPFGELKIMPVNQQAENNIYSLFPNPARGQLYISLSEDAIRNPLKLGFQQIQLLDGSGKIQKEVKVPPHTLEAQLDVAELKPGLYFLRIFNGKVWSVQKVLIQ